jgi:hypothetical protein
MPGSFEPATSGKDKRRRLHSTLYSESLPQCTVPLRAIFCKGKGPTNPPQIKRQRQTMSGVSLEGEMAHLRQSFYRVWDLVLPCNNFKLDAPLRSCSEQMILDMASSTILFAGE